MKKIDAYKCELTGAIFEEEMRAKKSEFGAMMKRVSGSLPHMGSITSDAIMMWLAGNIQSEVYPTVIDKLQEALNYYQHNVRQPKVITVDHQLTPAEASELKEKWQSHDSSVAMRERA